MYSTRKIHTISSSNRTSGKGHPALRGRHAKFRVSEKAAGKFTSEIPPTEPTNRKMVISHEQCYGSCSNS